MIDPGSLVASMVALSAPLVLAAMGGLVSERAGVMNIALEGAMLTAACIVAMVGIATGSWLVALAAGVLAGVVVMSLHALFTQAYHIDHIVSGMALNAMALGGTTYLIKALIDPADILRFPRVGVWGFWVAALTVAVGLAWYLARTRGGLHLLAVGNDPEKSRQMGLDPVRVRYVALVASGVLCGLSGALMMQNSGTFTDGMTAGRGFIALAALILGGWRPVPTLLGCAMFGFLDAMQLQLQGQAVLGLDVPSEFWNSLPYVVTLVVIAVAGLRGRSRVPAGLGRP